FFKIHTGDNVSIYDPIFFQFMDHPNGELIKANYGEQYIDHANKRALVLESFDLQGLKNEYERTGSWEDVFHAFEFIAPTYVYEKRDMAGRPYIINGRLTGNKKLSINVVFNYKNVIDHNPDLKTALEAFDWKRREEFLFKEQTALVLYMSVILLIIIGVLSMFGAVKIIDKRS
ncbi:MAG: hypothetical protein R3182_09630, partial [Draconibacterium sp.]|nr:hypothetical protein [Draconibacterium sp.]